MSEDTFWQDRSDIVSVAHAARLLHHTPLTIERYIKKHGVRYKIVSMVRFIHYTELVGLLPRKQRKILEASRHQPKEEEGHPE